MWYLVVIVVAALVSVALAPKPPEPKPASLSDVDAPTAEEGRPIPVVFGTVLLRGANVVWYGDLAAEPAVAIAGAPLFFLPLMQKSFSYVPLDMWGPRGMALMSFSKFLGTWWPVATTLVVVAIAWAFAALPRWIGPTRAKFDASFLPYRLYRDARAAEFLATLAAVLKKRGNVSMNLREGLELIRSNAGLWLADHCSRMLEVLNEPGSHNDADVLDSGLLSKESVYYVADVMEALGPDEGLQVAGLRIEARVDESIAKVGKRLRYVMLAAGLSTVAYMVLWGFSIISELKAATAIVFS